MIWFWLTFWTFSYSKTFRHAWTRKIGRINAIPDGEIGFRGKVRQNKEAFKRNRALLQQTNDILREAKVRVDKEVRVAKEEVRCLKQRVVKNNRVRRETKVEVEFKKWAIRERKQCFKAKNPAARGKIAVVPEQLFLRKRAPAREDKIFGGPKRPCQARPLGRSNKVLVDNRKDPIFPRRRQIGEFLEPKGSNRGDREEIQPKDRRIEGKLRKIDPGVAIEAQIEGKNLRLRVFVH